MTGSRARPRSGPALLGLVMFGSGLAGLVFEVVWIRQLALVLGGNTHALSIVLAAYMAGIALGSIRLGGLAERRAATQGPAGLARLLALLLGLTGATGLAVTVVVPWLGPVVAPLLRLVGWNSPWALLLRGLFGFLLLLAPTVLMGGQLPVAARLAVESRFVVGRRLALLYGLNTLGAVGGALLAGFLLLERLGVSLASLAAAGLCVLLAALALRHRGQPGRAAENRPHAEERRPPRQAGLPEPVRYGPVGLAVLAAGFLLSGLAGLGQEVVWTRALVTVMGQPTYGSTVVLAGFLLGLALGGLAGGRLSDRSRDPLFAFGLVELGIGLSALGAVFLLARSSALFGPVAIRLGASWAGLIVGLAGFAFGVMLVPTLAMGMTFPLASRAWVAGTGGLASRVGLLSALNTVGALVGALLVGFLLVPRLGTGPASLALAGVSLAVGVAAVLAARARLATRLVTVLAGAGLFVAAAVVLAPGRLRVLPPTLAQDGGADWRVMYHRETVDGVVVTAENRAGVRQTWVGSSVVCGTALPALRPVRQMGTIPFAINPAPERVLVIGYGLGVATALFVELSDGPVDCVEIAPRVVEASRDFAKWNNRVYEHPRLAVLAGDGRNFLLATNRQYDFISCDPTHPALGSGALYTVEFYELCRRRLRPGGVMTQYLPLHKLEPGDFRAVVNTFRQAFPDCALWRGVSHAVLVGRKDRPLAIEYEALARLFERMKPGTRAALAEVFIDEADDLIAGMALNAGALAEFTRGAGLFSDDRPGLEYRGARASDTRTWRLNAEGLLARFSGPAGVLYRFGPDSLRVTRRLQLASAAEQAKFRATLAAVSGRQEEQVAEFRRALMFYPADREAETFLRMSGGGR
ncbi:MAG: fused MFS/spermidine synthase [bacterium]